MAEKIVKFVLFFLINSFLLGAFIFRFFLFKRYYNYEGNPETLMTGQIPADKLKPSKNKKYYFWIWLIGSLVLSFAMLFLW